MIKLIVGLGNPGTEYEKTRHNFGRVLAARFGNGHKGHRKDWRGSIVIELKEKLALTILLPNDFMNLSGKAVSEFSRYFKVEPSEIMVIHDDVDLPLGEIRLREDGASGGHKGVESIIKELATNNFWRLRLGVGRPAESTDQAVVDFVLARFNKEEERQANLIIDFVLNNLLSSICNKPEARTWQI